MTDHTSQRKADVLYLTTLFKVIMAGERASHKTYDPINADLLLKCEKIR